jgi:predicted Zn-dependent protease
MHAGRLLALAGCLVLAAWFVLDARQAQETADVSAIVSQTAPVTAAQAAHATSLLASAAKLNPDRSVQILRGELLLRRHHAAQARSALLGVTHAEPQNFLAWYWLADASASAPRTFYAAELRMEQLDPELRKLG